MILIGTILVLVAIVLLYIYEQEYGKVEGRFMILKFVYTLFIGILLTAFVGVGIEAFHPSPTPPEYPSALKIPREGGLSGPVFQEMKSEQEKYDNLFSTFREKQKIYNRNVSIISIIVSVLTLIVSLTLFKKILLIADGLLLGGVLTLFYSIIRGFDSGNNMFRFIVVSIGLVIALALGYLKFIKPSKA